MLKLISNVQNFCHYDFQTFSLLEVAPHLHRTTLVLKISCRSRTGAMSITIEKVDMSLVEIITSVARGCRWSSEEKWAMGEEAESRAKSFSAVARKYGVHPNHLFRWRRLIRESALSAGGANEAVVLASELKALKARILVLEPLLGRKTIEVEILKESITTVRDKKLLLRKPLRKGGRHPRK